MSSLTKHNALVPLAKIEPSKVLAIYARTLLIRTVEERLISEYPSRNIRCAIHLSIGQEGVASGILLAAELEDTCMSTHRCHAHYLAKGGNLQEMIDELYGLETGCSHGRGGSMHLFDKKANMWGSSAIVGGSVPLVTGMGLAFKQQKSKNVAIAFGGDGSIDEGSFYESLNLAAVLNLPVLFVVENNGYSTLTPQAMRQAQQSIIRKAKSFGVDAETLDGNDTLALYMRAREILQMIRQQSKPFLIEAHTYRACAHVGPVSDFGTLPGQRSFDELNPWKERDPLTLLEIRIEHDYPELQAQLIRCNQEIKEQVETAFVRAKAAFAELAPRLAPPPAAFDPSKV